MSKKAGDISPYLESIHNSLSKLLKYIDAVSSQTDKLGTSISGMLSLLAKSAKIMDKHEKQLNVMEVKIKQLALIVANLERHLGIYDNTKN